MNRYELMFKTLKNKKQGAYIPFVTLGDPGFNQSVNIIKILIQGGADALELGIPFSDPMADGPTIQNANIRALSAGITPESSFEIISKVREFNSEIPIGILVYANLIYANGIESFYKKCKESGVDSVLIADVPTIESDPFTEMAQKFKIDTVFILPPDSSEETLNEVAQKGKGYTYLLSRSGVTGTEQEAVLPSLEFIKKLTLRNAPPAVLGFGISKPSQVKRAITLGLPGVISGSAVVKIIEKNLTNTRSLNNELLQFTYEMKEATIL